MAETLVAGTFPTEGQAAAEAAATVAKPTTGSDAATGAPAPTPSKDQGQTTGDGKGTEPGASKDKPQGAPEKYEFKAEKGHEFDPEVLGAFSDVARELNLSQESAQKVLDKVAPVLNQRQVARIEAARTEWAESAKADKEFGGDKLQESLTAARKALDKFGSPELRAMLDESGLGNHPELIRLLVRAGKAVSSDTFVGGNGQTRGPANLDDANVQAEILYRKK